MPDDPARSPADGPPALLPPVATAYPATARALRDACGAAAVDEASFERPLARCALAACRGTCCTAGVTLNPEEAMVLEGLVRREGAALRALLPAMPDRPVVRAPTPHPVDGRDPWDDDAADEAPARTALVPRRYHGVVSGYPPHFADAACAFLTPDARCALQLLAVARARHPWYWKPLACWLHPIAASAARIYLPDAGTDRHAAADGPDAGFASATFCGRAAPGGAPARAVLAPELAVLGALLGRDLGAAGAGPPAPNPA